MVKIPSIMNARYRIEKKETIPGYIRITDTIHQKELMGRLLPKIKTVETSLRRWSRYTHPCFAQVFRYLEYPSNYLVIMRPIEPGSLPLSELKPVRLKTETLVDILINLIHAYHFLFSRDLYHPQLDLSKIYYHERFPVRIVGHETALPMDILGSDDQITNLDIRYTAPEMLLSKTRTPKSDMYHLAALICHFLTGKSLTPNGRFKGITQHFRKLRKPWDALLAAMLHDDPLSRPDWREILDQADGLRLEPKDETDPVWLGFEDRQTLEELKAVLAQSKKKTGAIAFQVYPGREKIQRLAPFTKFAEEQRFLVFHSWLSKKQTQHYKAINDIMLLLRQGVVRYMNRPDFTDDLTPLSEWHSTEDLMAKWRILLKRIFQTLVPEYGDGIVLIIEDVQHMDKASLETLSHFSNWLGNFPFLLLISGPTYAHANFTEFRKKWPYDWRYLHPAPMDKNRLLKLVWNEGRALPDEEIQDILYKTNGEEVFVFYWLEDFYRQNNAINNFMHTIWEDLAIKDKMILKVLSCSERPLSRRDIEQAFEMTRIRKPMERLEKFRYIRSDSEGFRMAIPLLIRFCRERIRKQDMDHIRQRLMDYELGLENPNPVQCAYLSCFLKSPDERQPYFALLERPLYEEFDVSYLWRLERVYQQEQFFEFKQFSLFAQMLRGKPQPTDVMRRHRALTHLASALRSKERGDLEKAVVYYQKWARSRNLAQGLRAYALIQLAEAHFLVGDKLGVSRCWRQFQRLDLKMIYAPARQEWLTRFQVLAEITGNGFSVSQAEPLPEHLSAWLEAERAWENGAFRESVALAHTALAQIKDHYDLNWKGMVYKLYGNGLYRTYRPEEAIQAYRQAENCFAQTNHATEIKSIRFNLATSECLAGRFTSAISSFQPLLKQAVSSGDSHGQCHIFLNLMTCALFLNDGARFEELYQKHAKLAQQIKSADERVAGLSLHLHASFNHSKDEIMEEIQELEALLTKKSFNQLLTDEAAVAIRIGRFVLGLQCDPPNETPDLTRWRHQLLNLMIGGQEISFPELVQDIGEGYFGACHFFLLKCVIEKKLIPRVHFSEYLLTSYENHARTTGAHYGPFLKKHLAHLRNLGEVPRGEWDQALQLFESLDWRNPDASSLQTGLLHELQMVWPFDLWGAYSRGKNGWRPIVESKKENITDHLSHLNLKRLDAPLVSTFHDPLSRETRSLLMLPVSPGHHRDALVWFLNKRAAIHDLGSHYEPLFRFYGKLFEGLLERTLAVASKATEDAEGALEKNNAPTRQFGIVGRSQVIQDAIAKIKNYAPSNLSIYIWGESGTGKELAARAIHVASERAKKPFRAINCSHFPDNLVASELFGHVRGAFTGAANDKAGLLELVDGGTIFLDEIGDIDAKVQSLLLRVIQEGEFSRIGETRIRRVDLRFIIATNKNIHQLIDAGVFRADLFFRLVEEEIRLPPLRNRFEDLPLLIAHFKNKHEPSRKVKFRQSFYNQLRQYHWPGNIRELESYIRKILVHWREYDVITAEECLPFMREVDKPTDMEKTLSELEEAYRAYIIQERLNAFGWNKTQTAISLGMSRQQLINLISKYGLKKAP